jgi:hypothetical protein
MKRSCFLLIVILFLGLTATLASAVPLCAAGIVCNVHFFPPMPNEPIRAMAFSDRRMYLANDPVAHIVVSFVGQAGITNPNREIDLSVLDPAGAVIILRRLAATEIMQPDFEFFLDMQRMSFGDIMVTATLIDASNGAVQASASVLFRRDTQVVPIPPFSGAIAVEVGPQSVLSGAHWPISTGIPLPEGALFDSGALGLFENGVRVPAQFTARGAWRPLGGSIKWLGLDFTAVYDGTVPRRYALQSVPAGSTAPPSSLNVSLTATEITVSNGLLEFHVNRRHFAGIEDVLFRENQNAGLQRAMISGGPFLVDETGTRYTAVADLLPVPATADSGVEVQEVGPQRVTIRAEGWYASATGSKLCKFVTRISAYAGQPFVRISHRTLITYDTRNDRIQDLGWDNIGVFQNASYAFGIEGAPPFSSAAPPPGNGVFLHQEKADAFRIVSSGGTNLAGGVHSEGWITVRTAATPQMTLAIRDIYQKFPKELELEDVAAPIPSGDVLHLVAHFWPKHGRNVFPGAPTDTARENVYKLRYAHQGSLLQLQPPADYRAAVSQYLTEELLDPDSDGEVTGMNRANGQGLAIGNELLLLFHGPKVSLDQVGAEVALFREDPHAIADTKWNAESGVLGQLSASDPLFDKQGERALEVAEPGYLHGIVESGDEYGMWVYGNIHDNWDPSNDRALIHRVWSASHYQNVWGDWLLYFRSGQPDKLRWARVHSDHHMDIDTNNFDDGTGLHGRAGYMYHVKGFVPWGGDSGILEHWINPSAFLLRYNLTGDRRALELARTWFSVAGPGTLAPLGPVGTLPCSAWANSFMRDRVTYLGEIVEYYQNTWDPHSLMVVGDESRNLLDVPFECTGSAGDHPIWTKQWFSRYYDLSHDPRVVQRLTAWSAAGFEDLTVNAFLYRTTGNDNYLRRMLPDFYDAERIYYDSPGERYHGYGQWVTAIGQIWLQQVPYFWRALKAAGLTSERGDKRVTYPGRQTNFPISGGPAGLPSRSWSDSSSVVVALTRPYLPLNVSMDALLPFGDARGQFFVLAPPPSPPAPTSVFVPSSLLFSQQYFFNSAFPLTFQLPNPVPAALYRVEVRSAIPRIFAPYTNLQEAAVLRRRFFENGCEHQGTYVGVDRQLFYFSPSRPHSGVIDLKIGAANGKDDFLPASALPVYYRVETTAGGTVQEGNMFLYGNRQSVDLLLTAPSQPLGTPEEQPVWRLYTATTYGPRLEVHDGAEELLIAVKQPDLAAVWSALPQITTTPVCPTP